MIEIGALVRVMNAIRSDSVLVGLVRERLAVFGAPVKLFVMPSFGPPQWVDETTCEVLQPSDI